MSEGPSPLTPEDRRIIDLLYPIAREHLAKWFRFEIARGVTEADLYSAYHSFKRHCEAGEAAEVKNMHELASLLIRVTRNRARRKRDAEARQSTQGAEWHRTGGRLADQSEATPEGVAADREQVEYLQELIADCLEELATRPKKAEVIRLHLEEPGLPQREIARRVGVSDASVSRWLEEFREDLRRKLTDPPRFDNPSGPEE